MVRLHLRKASAIGRPVRSGSRASLYPGAEPDRDEAGSGRRPDIDDQVCDRNVIDVRSGDVIQCVNEIRAKRRATLAFRGRLDRGTFPAGIRVCCHRRFLALAGRLRSPPAPCLWRLVVRSAPYQQARQQRERIAPRLCNDPQEEH
jgi:hypothetical protein